MNEGNHVFVKREPIVCYRPKRRSSIRLAVFLGIVSLCALRVGAAQDTSKIIPFVDELFLSEMKEEGIPAAAVALIHNGAVVYAKGYGEARPGIPTDADTPFHIGSITKSMTSLGLMILVEEGKIELDSPATRYLPYFRMADPRYASITVHDLLSQCSGLSTSQGISYPTDPQYKAMRDLIIRLDSARLNSDPGTRFEYSNYNHILVGAIIEAVSGIPYARFMKERVFGPLGMSRTSADRDEAEALGIAIGSRGFFGWTLRGQVDYAEGAVPAGYVVSSARDMGVYMAFMQRRGLTLDGTRILRAESVDRMISRQSAIGSTSMYGYGWVALPKTFEHDGNVAGYLADVLSTRYSPGWGWAILVGKSDKLAELFMTSSFERIQTGLRQILESGTSSNLAPSRAGRYRLIASLVAIAILAILVLSALSLLGKLRAHTTAIERKPILRLLSSLGAIALHLILPVGLIVVPPIVVAAPWSCLSAFVPDVTSACWVPAAVLLCIGAIKFVRFTIVRVVRSRNSKSAARGMCLDP